MTIREEQETAVLQALVHAYNKVNRPVSAEEVRRAGVEMQLHPRSAGHWGVFDFVDRTKKVLDNLVRTGTVKATIEPRQKRVYRTFSDKRISRTGHTYFARRGPEEDVVEVRPYVITKYEPT
jgi:hypothetical protein